MKKHIPNIITLANLSCGVLALFWMLEGEPLHCAAFLVLLAALFDLLDGLAARLLKVTSAIGKDLDSLADLVSFGVVPAAIVFEMAGSAEDGIFSAPLVKYLALLIAVLSTLRLARFNNDSRQTQDFIGLPTPAHALFWISWPLILWEQNNFDLVGVWPLPISQESFFLFLFVLPLLLNSGLKMFSLKFVPGGWMANRQRYVFLVMSAVLLLLCFVVANVVFLALPLIILLYIILSVIFNFIITNWE